MARYTITYETDEDGVIVGSITEVSGCRTQGATRDQVRERIREALALFVDDADSAELVDAE